MSLLYFYKIILIIGIKLKVDGHANTGWSESRKVRNSQGKLEIVPENLYSYEDYITINFYLFGSDFGKSKLIFFPNKN